jgi:hypothetical protein
MGTATEQLARWRERRLAIHRWNAEHTYPMRIELDPDLPETLAEALDADGRLIAQFSPALEDAPPGTTSLRVSSAAFDHLLGALEAVSR